MKKINIKQHVLESGYPWLETILFFSDNQADIYKASMGLFHCQQCDSYQGFCFPLPPKYVCFKHIDGCFDEINCKDNRYINDAPDKTMHNARNAFWRQHSHGDGRILLFEKDL